MSDVLLGVGAARGAVARGEASALELADEALARVAARNDELAAFVEVDPALTHRWARSAGGGGLLAGVPVAVKDMVDVRGLHTRAGSSFLGAQPALQDAAVVRRLRKAGAVVVGKTATTEFACGPHLTANSPVPRNPYDAARTPGGSSGGSAVAVAAGMVPVAVGTDTAASIRQPSGFCGLAGLRPTAGVVSVDGVVPLAPAFDTVGPIARTVGDVAILFEVMSGRRMRPPLDERPWTVGVVDVTSWAAPEAEVVTLHARALDRLRRDGLRLVTVRLPAGGESFDAAMLLLARQAWRTHRAWFARHGGRYDAQVHRFLSSGRDAERADVRAARTVAESFCLGVARALSRVDALVLPVAPTQPWPLTMKPVPGQEPPGRHGLRYTAPWMVTRRPVLAVPAGVSSAGLPFGLQLVGELNHEETLLALGSWVEQRLAPS
ncbi:MAG: amidase [Nocardioidaceae bacterium]|nr:amidase [Nocardioidaceae bacterium]